MLDRQQETPDTIAPDAASWGIVTGVLSTYVTPPSDVEFKEAWVASAATDRAGKYADLLRQFGLAPVVTRRALHRIDDAELPCVVIGKAGDVALLSAHDTKNVTLLLETDTSPQTMTTRAFRKWHSGKVILLERTKVDRRTAKDRLLALNPVKILGVARFAWIALAAFLSNVLGLATSIFVMVVYDRVLPNEASESLYALAIGVGIAIAFDSILKSARAGIVERATIHSDAQVTEDIFDQYVAVSQRKDRQSVGQLAAIMRDFEMFRDFMTSAMILTFVDLPFVLVFVYVIYLISGWLCIVPMIAIPVVLFLVLAVQPLLARHSAEKAEVSQSRHGMLIEVLAGLDALRVTGAYGLMKNRFLSLSKRHVKAGNQARRSSQFVGSMIALVQQIVQVAVIVLGFQLFVADQITTGAIIAAVMLSGKAMGPLARIGQAMGRSNTAFVAYRNLKDFLGEERTQDVPDMRLGDATQKADAVRLYNVTYALAENAPPLFDKVSLRIGKGEKVAVVGKTGSGKTTLLRLMNGLISPEAGSVMIEGATIAAYPRAALHEKIGAVFQFPWLCAGTLRENLRYGAPDISDDDLKRALSVAGMGNADSTIELNMHIADQGANVSGGQRQAISLARALVFDPSILLLDEPTSAMDSQLETHVINQLRENMADKTVIIVTHKAKILDMCDRVIVVDQGRIAGDMSKEKYLLAVSGQKKPQNG